MPAAEGIAIAFRAIRRHHNSLDQGRKNMSQLLRYRLITLTLLIALVLGACASPTPVPTQPPAPAPTKAAEVVPTKAQPAQPADDSWAKVQQAGQLLVGPSADYAPFESYDS